MNALDTNVLMYACDQRDSRLQQIALGLVHSTSDGVLLWQVACEFVGASRKLSDQGFSKTDAWRRLSELTRMFPLILPTQAVLARARMLHLEQQWSFWDATIVAASLEGVTRLYSEDMPGRKPPAPLEIIHPFA